MQERGEVEQQVGSLLVNARVALVEHCAPELFGLLTDFCSAEFRVGEELDAVRA